MSIHYGHKDVLEYFETPEGAYKLKAVIPPKCLPGITGASRLSSVRLSFCDSRNVCCINCGRDICIYPFSGCRMFDSHASGKQTFKTSAPVCHDFGVSSLLLVGLASGEIHTIDPFHKELCKVFNEEKFIERTPVTCIRWVPYSTNQFLVAHASGHMYLYNEELPCCPTPPIYQLFKKGTSYVVYTCKTKSTCNPLYNWALTGVHAESSHSKTAEDFDNSTASLPSINQFAFSTCGKYLAVVTEDGYLRVFDYHRMQLYGFMRSYFGGLTCVDWSPDGKYVVVGGQDDLVTVWSFDAQAVICRGRGHKSWTSVVRFDPFVYPTANGDVVDTPNTCLRTYRLGSVGQDTFLCLWELTEDVIRQGLRFSTQFHFSHGSTNHHNPFSANSPTVGEGDTVGEKSRTVPRGTSGGKSRPFLSSFRVPSSRHSDHGGGDSLGKSSVVSEPVGGGAETLNGHGCRLPSITSKDLLGTPNCPRLSDVPILEPFAKFGIARDLITDLVFREDSLNLAFQQGDILTYTRPQLETCSMTAAGDLSIFNASNLVGRGVGVGVGEDVESCPDDDDGAAVADEVEECGEELTEGDRSDLLTSLSLPRHVLRPRVPPAVVTPPPPPSHHSHHHRSGGGGGAVTRSPPCLG